MNYQLHYNNLIIRAQGRILNEYTEKHHIIPKCLGGSNNPENIVDLTPEEHYIAHLLLVKMHPNNRKLIFSARMMTISPYGKRNNNKMFGWLKRKISILGHSEESCEKIRNSHLGSKRSVETKSKMSKLQKDRGGYGPKKFSEAHKQKLSESHSGISLPERSESHRRNLSKSLKGKPSTPGFTGKHHSVESKLKTSATQLSKNLEPWETGSVISNIEVTKLWKQLDIVYYAWMETGMKGHRIICNYLGWPIKSSVENMIKWIKKNGNPTQFKKWNLFKEE